MRVRRKPCAISAKQLIENENVIRSQTQIITSSLEVAYAGSCEAANNADLADSFRQVADRIEANIKGRPYRAISRYDYQLRGFT